MKKLQSIVLSTILSSTLLQANNLEKVIVTAKTKQNVETTAGSITVITQEQIKQMHVSSVQDILVQTVGVSLGVNSSSISGRESISIRGAQSKHTLILIDGKRISGTDAQISHSDFQYNWVPINSIAKIEIIRGPMSSIYGSKAIGGVINIITKKSNENFHGGISLLGANSSANGGNERDISLNLGGKISKKLKLSLAAENKEIKATYKKSDNTKILREGKKIKNILLDLDYKIDNTQNISASYLRGKEIRSNTVTPGHTGITTFYDEYYEINKTNYSLAYKKNFSDLTMDIKYYINQSDSHTDQYNYTHELKDSVLNTEFAIDIFDNQFIIAGLEYRTEAYDKVYDTSSTGDFSDKISYKSAYVQDEIEVNDALVLTLGTRYDKHERFGAELSPKANIVYSINENHKLKASYGHGFNAPTVTENSSSYKVGHGPSTFYQGNDNLKAEKSDTYELGYEFYFNDISFKSAIFYTNVKDLISSKVISTSPTVNQYSNINKSTMSGIELEYSQKDLFQDLDVSIAYDYLRTKNKDTNKELTRKPKQNVAMNLSYALPYGIHSNMHLNYTGSQLDTSSDPLGGYTTYSLQFSKNFTKSFSGKVGVDNLSNKILSDESDYNIKGRLLYVGLDYSF
ncbi:MAG: TonB-dependent receptor [Campylobacteraceae bacterium]|nr:TonB-dependent receptor [Campylobacteraceae bacterium]